MSSAFCSLRTPLHNRKAPLSSLLSASARMMPSLRLVVWLVQILIAALNGSASNCFGQSRPEFALIEASAKGNLAQVRKLLDQGTSVNAKRLEEGTTPLIAACNRAHYDVAKFLLDRGADVNSANRNGWTPLMGAASGGDKNLVRLLIDRGADVKARHAYGWTALKLAGSKGHQGVLELLGKDVKK
jgi:ankyrin repeat protein